MVEGVNTNGNGPAWILRHESIRNWLWEVAQVPDFYVAVGDRATIMTSSDGVAWEPEAVPDSATNAILLGVGGMTNFLIAVGNKGTILISPATLTNVVTTNYQGDVAIVATNPVSMLGVRWYDTQPRPTTNDLQAVAASGNRFVLAGSQGTILTSADGTNWTAFLAPTNVFLSGAASFPGGFVLAGDKGVILASADGQNWTLQTSGTTNWIYRVRWLNGQLIAVGQNGTLLVSTDGANWCSRTTGITKWLNDVAFAGETYYAIGNQGTILASSNTVAWSNIGTITEKSLFGATGQNGQLVVVGVEGAIIRSQLVPNLTPVVIRNFVVTPPTNTVARKLFLISGEPDQQFSIENSFSLTNWAPGPILELLDPSGTLLYLEEGASDEKEFFRARMAP
jgi:photosystem II stability/assembly factor-like uncharacterized protein